MNRRVSDDTATYAADCLASADINLARLIASCALFAALLAGMTFVDAPLPRNQFYVQAGDPQSTSSISGSERKQEPGEC
jgi:hypothetical protein